MQGGFSKQSTDKSQPGTCVILLTPLATEARFLRSPFGLQLVGSCPGLGLGVTAQDTRARTWHWAITAPDPLRTLRISALHRSQDLRDLSRSLLAESHRSSCAELRQPGLTRISGAVTPVPGGVSHQPGSGEWSARARRICRGPGICMEMPAEQRCLRSLSYTPTPLARCKSWAYLPLEGISCH